MLRREGSEGQETRRAGTSHLVLLQSVYRDGAGQGDRGEAFIPFLAVGILNRRQAHRMNIGSFFRVVTLASSRLPLTTHHLQCQLHALQGLPLPAKEAHGKAHQRGNAGPTEGIFSLGRSYARWRRQQLFPAQDPQPILGTTQSASQRPFLVCSGALEID